METLVRPTPLSLGRKPRREGFSLRGSLGSRLAACIDELGSPWIH
jgi:hypothetical protein